MPKTETFQSHSKLPLLHAIRGLAAFYVVMFHAKFILWSGGHEFLLKFPRSNWNFFDYVMFGINMMFNGGVQMVMIFFVLSGFFIAMSLERKELPLHQKLKTFYSIRFIRIYTPYLSSILISVAVLFFIQSFSPGLYTLHSDRQFNSRLVVAYHDVTINNFVKALFFEHNKEYIGFNYAYWSLLYEGIFYLIAPFIQSVRKYYLLVSCIFFVSGVVLFSLFNIDNVFLKFLFQFNFYFALGQAIYFYRQKITTLLASKNLKKTLIFSSVLLYFAFDFLAVKKLEFYANFLSAVTGGLLILLFLNYDMKNNYFIRSIKGLGKISYSLYLIHIPTLVFVYTLIYHFTGKVVLYNWTYLSGVGASLVTAFILYKAAEEPSLLLIRRIKNLRKAKPIEPKVALAR